MNNAIKQINTAKTILVIQAENPDGDSLASSIALESILSQIDKNVIMYCPVEMPGYLRYISGWDRVENKMADNFDLAILVDASTDTLLERVLEQSQFDRLKSKPLVIIDHHANESKMPLKTIDYIDSSAVSTGQMIYEMASHAGWLIDSTAAENIATSILSDSLGLTSPKTTSRTVHILADCVEKGADLAVMDDRRRAFGKKTLDIFYYKGKLIERVELYLDNRLAIVHIPWEEIEAYSHAYNPSMLVIDEMRSIEGVIIAAAFKTYPDGKVTCKIRANSSGHIADDIAGHFGGGGHPYAAGFKVYDQPYPTIKNELIELVKKSLN